MKISRDITRTEFKSSINTIVSIETLVYTRTEVSKDNDVGKMKYSNCVTKNVRFVKSNATYLPSNQQVKFVHARFEKRRSYKYTKASISYVNDVNVMNAVGTPESKNR